MVRIFPEALWLNPSNADEATFVQSTRTQRFLKTIQILLWWYSLDSSSGVLTDKYLFARISIISQISLQQQGRMSR